MSEDAQTSGEDGATVAEGDVGFRGGLRRWFERLGPLVMLIALVAVFALTAGDSFYGLANLRTVLVHAAILVTAALGMTMILISGGLDLSVGSTIALSGVVGALVFTTTDSTALAAAACLATGLGVGAVNGFLIAGMRMSPFIITLGMLGIARGLARILAEDSHVSILVRDADGRLLTTWMHDLLSRVPRIEPWAAIGLPLGLIIVGALAVLMGLAMRRTVFGRRVYALGSNEEAARLCGISVGWTKFAIYLLGGLLFGLAGLLNLGFEQRGSGSSREGFELEVIAAVVIGGASLTGGVGSVLGSVVGALIIVVLNNGFVHLGVDAPWQLFAIGWIIVAAVALDLFRQGKLHLPGLSRRR